jgi:hypothetical protein
MPEIGLEHTLKAGVHDKLKSSLLQIVAFRHLLQFQVVQFIMRGLIIKRCMLRSE